MFLALNITYGDDGEDARAWKDGKGTGLVAVKFEPKIVEHHRLHDRAHAYNSLVGGPGIPFVHCSGSTEHYRYIVLDLLGPSLEEMFEFCDRKFTLKTILLIADQALSRIEYIHSQSCAHRDVKAENLVIGLGTFIASVVESSSILRFAAATFKGLNALSPLLASFLSL